MLAAAEVLRLGSIQGLATAPRYRQIFLPTNKCFDPTNPSTTLNMADIVAFDGLHDNWPTK
ncbi:hypothetical protein Alg130_12086 [Pyrenophora tritici-repentis]|nr:hypothetical protein Alg130_12086 [Pyrenophora tritici-repentis]KAI0568887.1 hypothetical protein Alg215_11945 [Pyrenophora tritici-repentis]